MQAKRSLIGNLCKLQVPIIGSRSVELVAAFHPELQMVEISESMCGNTSRRVVDQQMNVPDGAAENFLRFVDDRES